MPSLLPPAPPDLPPNGFATSDSNQGFEEDEGGLDLSRYVAALLRYKWLILGLTVLGTAGGIAASRIVKPVYETHASIQIPAPMRGFSSPNPLRSAPLLEGRGWLELVRSFAVLDEVVKRRRLYLELESLADSIYFRVFELGEDFRPGRYRLISDGDSRLRLETYDGVVLESGVAADSVGRSLGFAWSPGSIPAGRSVDFRVRALRDASVQLGNDMTTALPTDGALMRLSLRHVDGAAAAATLNAVASRFVEVATLLKREKLTTVTEVLSEQLESARLDLTRAEQARERFRVSTITLPSDRGATPIASGLQETRDPVRDAFFQLRLDREALARDRDAVVRATEAPEDTLRSIVTSLSTIPAVRESPELQNSLTLLTEKRAELRQMRLIFAETHGPLRQLEREVEELTQRTIPAQARVLADNLSTRVADLDQRIAASSREMQQIPLRVTEEARGERDVDVAELIYTELQRAYEQARLSELSAAPDVRVLDFAVPPTRPVRDQMLFILAGGLFGGLGLGVVLALVGDRFDSRFRYPDQITKDLGLPILGALPLVHTRRNGTTVPDDAAHLIESVRTIRMASLYAHGTAGAFVTTVTSPGSGDGKSFVSANLARSFALSGRRTLLIDGDTRRGIQHRTLGVGRKPGLMDVLDGAATLEQAVRAVADGGFDLLPCGTRKAAAPELLASAAMAQMLAELRKTYQAIIVDSPPLAAGIDPLILGSLTGTIILVVRNGVTDRELAETRLVELDRLPIRTLGAVLNEVSNTGIYRYYSYLPGYRAEDEVAPVEPSKKRLLGRG